MAKVEKLDVASKGQLSVQVLNPTVIIQSLLNHATVPSSQIHDVEYQRCKIQNGRAMQPAVSPEESFGSVSQRDAN